jgi:hypothetical protein
MPLASQYEVRQGEIYSKEQGMFLNLYFEGLFLSQIYYFTKATY